MIGGDPQEFLDGLYYGFEQVFVYRGRTLCAQGWREPDGRWLLTVDQWDLDIEDWHVWDHRSVDPQECFNAFLTAPLFDGRTFWEAEGEIEHLYA